MMLHENVGRVIKVTGTAMNSKGGAVLVLENDIVFIRGMHSWSDSHLGKKITMAGLLEYEKYIPDPTKDEDGAISQGAEGMQYVLSAPTIVAVEE